MGCVIILFFSVLLFVCLKVKQKQCNRSKAKIKRPRSNGSSGLLSTTAVHSSGQQASSCQMREYSPKECLWSILACSREVLPHRFQFGEKVFLS